MAMLFSYYCQLVTLHDTSMPQTSDQRKGSKFCIDTPWPFDSVTLSLQQNSIARELNGPAITVMSWLTQFSWLCHMMLTGYVLDGGRKSSLLHLGHTLLVSLLYNFPWVQLEWHKQWIHLQGVPLQCYWMGHSIWYHADCYDHWRRWLPGWILVSCDPAYYYMRCTFDVFDHQEILAKCNPLYFSCWVSTENHLDWTFKGPAILVLVVSYVKFGQNPSYLILPMHNDKKILDCYGSYYVYSFPDNHIHWIYSLILYWQVSLALLLYIIWKYHKIPTENKPLYSVDWWDKYACNNNYCTGAVPAGFSMHSISWSTGVEFAPAVLFGWSLVQPGLSLLILLQNELLSSNGSLLSSIQYW